MKYCIAAVLAFSLGSLAAVAQAPVRVPGEPVLTSKAAPTPKLRLSRDAPGVETRLRPVSLEEIRAVRQRNESRSSTLAKPQRLTVGIARASTLEPISAGALTWKPVDGGHAARVAVTSPAAGSLRVGLDLAGVPGDIELVFFGSYDPARIEGPVKVGEIADRTGTWWSPLTEGETQTLEIFVPGRHRPERLGLEVRAASHLFTTPSSGFAKRLQDIGDAGSCNVDLPCSPLASDSAFREAASSVAQMVFHDAGFTVLCTGTLLADADGTTQIPWFYGANHCFDNEDAPYKTAAQMQSVANTLTTLWGFESATCNSATPRSSWSQLGGGATFLYNNVASDVLFLRLNGVVPTVAFYSGWDATPLSSGNSIVAVHHPQGDLKKVSRGSIAGFHAPGVGGANASFSEARWSSGTTEVGSSGSGIWTPNAGRYYFRGGLWGGNASCTNNSGSDYYSRLDQAYPSIAQYLGTYVTPAHDYTDMWWNPNEDGWGLNLVQHPSRVIFGVWYTYDSGNKPVWYVLPSGSWTNPTTYTGTLYVTAGPPFNTPFDPSRVDTRPVGTATLSFNGRDNGTFTYSIDGVSGSKSMTRLVY